ncbi:hypothetical protein F5Y15DRAFT_205864 [Xylariaceae sp. FL0016]|nr:hypothetical protein F5Y15DRAFT_205864 [Xylariaceae sp. FL0016]
MGRNRGYSDDSDDIDIHFSHRHVSPARRPTHYVETRPSPRPQYLDDRFEDRYLAVGGRTTATSRTSRSRSRDRRSSPPAPLVINNRIYNLDFSDSEEDSHVSSHRRRSRSRSRASSRSSPKPDRYALEHVRFDYERELENKRREYERENEARQKEYDLDRATQELQELKLKAQIERDEKRRDRTMREERELREAKKELEEIREKKDRDDYERRLKQKLELERLKEEEKQLAEKKRRDKEAKEAVEKYKKEEAERLLKEKEEKEKREAEYRHKMQEQLLKSGLDEKEITAILAGKKVKQEKEKEDKERAQHQYQVPYQVPYQGQQLQYYEDKPRPTYTRMARRHLSLETLRVYNIDYVVDPDPDYVLIKRWVAEPEQDILWRHTRTIREQRSSGKLYMAIEDKKHHGHHLEPEFEWVRKKDRRRSRSPSLLTYLAGGKPA